MKKGNYISKEAAVETLQRLFANTPESDTASLTDIFAATERTDQPEETNRNWIANKMTQLKYHNLVVPVYKFEGRKKLDGIRLTIAGKTALGRLSADDPAANEEKPAGNGGSLPPANENKVTINDALAIVRALRTEYPDFEIIFTVKPKEDVTMTQG